MIPMTTRPRPLFAALLAALPLLLAGCDGGNDDDPGVGSVVTPGVTVSTPEPEPTISREAMLQGFSWPITGSCLPKGDQLMPNAPREYRNGTHEGVDMYAVDNCNAGITRGTPVMAAKAGTVIRADLDYVNPTAAQMQAYLADPNTDASFDAFRGRQVWVKLDDGGVYVNRYCHLDGIAPGIQVGSRVEVGQLIAYVGETGTPESISNPGHEYHLHFEMRIGDSYLGDDLPPAEVRRLYTTLFSP
jgi:murein DD-endopeptidase MepM/ murein hydrolase activator NlpD